MAPLKALCAATAATFAGIYLVIIAILTIGGGEVWSPANAAGTAITVFWATCALVAGLPRGKRPRAVQLGEGRAW